MITFGIEDQRPGDGDALGLPTGELVRSPVERRVGIDADVLEDLAHLTLCLGLEASPCHDLMRIHRGTANTGISTDRTSQIRRRDDEHGDDRRGHHERGDHQHVADRWPRAAVAGAVGLLAPKAVASTHRIRPVKNTTADGHRETADDRVPPPPFNISGT